MHTTFRHASWQERSPHSHIPLPGRKLHFGNSIAPGESYMPGVLASTLPQIAEDRLERLEARTARIGVIGLGYVGLPLSLLLSQAGFKVTGFDVDAKKIVDLEAGRSYIFRIPSVEIQAAIENGFGATDD